jgi:flotillin
MIDIKHQELQQIVEERRYDQLIQSERSHRLAPALAEAEAQERLADAALYSKNREAEGIQSIMEAKAEGVNRLLKSCGDNPDLARFYMGVDSNLWHKVAEESARAVQGMEPTITHWNTGSDTGSTGNALVRIAQDCIPLYSEIKGHLSTMSGQGGRKHLGD